MKSIVSDQVSKLQQVTSCYLHTVGVQEQMSGVESETHETVRCLAAGVTRDMACMMVPGSVQHHKCAGGAFFVAHVMSTGSKL